VIGLRQLSNQRLELYASRFPLDGLRPYLMACFKDAYATIVLYEDDPEAYHETGIYSFDAEDPVTFNYEEFQAVLIEEFNDRVAVCTVENLFRHLDRVQENNPMADEPFRNLVFSISQTPPSRELLMDWEKNITRRLKRVLYDAKSSEHFQLFPNEECVVYAAENHFTCVTSDREDLIWAVFEDVVERQMLPLTQPPLQPGLLKGLYQHLKTWGVLRIVPERLHTAPDGSSFLLVTYPKHHRFRSKQIAKIRLDEAGTPVEISDTEQLGRLQYQLRYTDLTLMPVLLVLSFMLGVVGLIFAYQFLTVTHT